MDDSVAYPIMIFSPMIFLQLWLNIRHDIVYINLRGKHSKTYLKKNKGSFWDWLFFMKYRDELDRRLYICHTCLLWLGTLSILLAVIYGFLWLLGHRIQHEWIPWLYAELDIVVTGLYILKIIYDRVMRK